MQMDWVEFGHVQFGATTRQVSVLVAAICDADWIPEILQLRVYIATDGLTRLRGTTRVVRPVVRTAGTVAMRPS
jgi:hypothetical protein